MGNTTHQLILHLSVNDPSDYEIRDLCESLNQKAERNNRVSTICKLDVKSDRPSRFTQDDISILKKTFKDYEDVHDAFAENFRLYVAGHGNWKAQTLADVTPDKLADLLGKAGLPSVRVISLLGCESARDLGTETSVPVDIAMNSFASELLKFLYLNYHKRTTIYARSHVLNTDHWGRKSTMFSDEFELEAQKPESERDYTYSIHKRARSKWKYFVDDKGHIRRSNAYTGNNYDDVDEDADVEAVVEDNWQ